MEEGLTEDVEEIDTLIAELEISKGSGKGNLILCVVNPPALLIEPELSRL